MGKISTETFSTTINLLKRKLIVERFDWGLHIVVIDVTPNCVNSSFKSRKMRYTPKFATYDALLKHAKSTFKIN